VMELLQNSKWKPLTAYALGAYLYPKAPNGYAYLCTVAGVSGANEPTWPTAINAIVSSGSATFKCAQNLTLDSPFMIGLVDGIVRMVISSVLIADATITDAKIKTLSADKLFAASGTIANAIIGTGHITNAMIDNIIQSASYVTGVSGWKINKAGAVEFNGGTFRGAVTFGIGSSGYANITDAPVIPDMTAFSSWVKPSTTLIDGNKIYTGDAYVDTLQIKGQAVTFPVGAYLVTKADFAAAWVPSELIRVTVASGGYPNIINFAFAFSGEQTVIYLCRGTTSNIILQVGAGSGESIYSTFAYTFYDAAPPAGNNDYILMVATGVSGAYYPGLGYVGSVFGNISLTALEAKR
jgi:hypothetical protein